MKFISYDSMQHHINYMLFQIYLKFDIDPISVHILIYPCTFYKIHNDYLRWSTDHQIQNPCTKCHTPSCRCHVGVVKTGTVGMRPSLTRSLTLDPRIPGGRFFLAKQARGVILVCCELSRQFPGNCFHWFASVSLPTNRLMLSARVFCITFLGCFR